MHILDVTNLKITCSGLRQPRPPTAAREQIAESSRWGNFGKCCLWKFLTGEHLQQLLENTFLRGETRKLKHACSKQGLWRNGNEGGGWGTPKEGSKKEPNYWGELPKPVRKQGKLQHGNICPPGTCKTEFMW